MPIRDPVLEPALLQQTVSVLLPYCDLVQAHLSDVADTNASAAAATIGHLSTIDQLATTIERTAAELETLVDAGDDRSDPRLADAAALLATHARAVSASSAQAVAEMQFEDITRQLLVYVKELVDAVRQQLDGVRGYADGRLDGAALRAVVRAIEHFTGRHVMHLQRTTHAAVAGTAAPQDPPASIELF